MDVQTEYDRRLEELTTKRSENALLDRQIDAAETKLTETIAKLDIGKEALSFLEKVANSRRGAMKSKIESILSEAIQLLYGPSYRVEMGYTVKRNRSDMTIEIVRDTPQGEVRRDPMGGTGGGVADTIALPLRMMVLLGSQQTDKVLVPDEPYKHLDPERVEIVADFLKLMSERLGVQLILCSHHRDQMMDKADKSYHVTEENGVSKVTER
jgi:DNA repair exonuclease SbcCD ATPase subunit